MSAVVDENTDIGAEPSHLYDKIQKKNGGLFTNLGQQRFNLISGNIFLTSVKTHPQQIKPISLLHILLEISSFKQFDPFITTHTA